MNENTLTRFSETFVPALFPLLRPLQESTQALIATRDQGIERAVLPELREITHYTNVLLEKVEEQQTYVLVFGPLKSGKSTLMNALAATYVSEVTSLPAYPCMVYVSHAPTNSFELTSFDGSTEVLRDPVALKERIDEAHAELAREVKAAEERGEEFDASLHFPAALRRIDVRLPAEELRESGAVLVDTPGLYSRMKFGYDAMTREFRNSAATAVFVVKTDNLFLEQVFQEFEQLLDLFSRIFLVVNVDPEKRDLGPEGELVPSTEAATPEKVVEAFRTFSMSQKMREADEEGRLEIYTIDLLNAARHRLRGEAEDEDSPVTVTRLRDDLVGFLSSSEYMVAFLNDSMKQGESLLGRLEEVLESEALDELAARLEQDRELLTAARERAAALDRLDAFDWEGATVAFEEKVRKDTESGIAGGRKRLKHRLEESVSGWFRSQSSLQELLQSDSAACFAEHAETTSEVVRQRLASSSWEPDLGLDLPESVRTDLATAEVSLGTMGRRPQATGEQADGASSAPKIPFEFDELPIQRSLVDYLLFRSNASIRRKLFGEAEKPSERVSVELKEKRLGDAGREALAGVLARAGANHAPKKEEETLREEIAPVRVSMLERVRAVLDTRRPDLERHVAELENRVNLADGVVEPVQNLTEETARARASFEELLDRFSPERQVELEPQPAPEETEAAEEGELALDGEGEEPTNEAVHEGEEQEQPVEAVAVAEAVVSHEETASPDELAEASSDDQGQPEKEA